MRRIGGFVQILEKIMPKTKQKQQPAGIDPQIHFYMHLGLLTFASARNVQAESKVSSSGSQTSIFTSKLNNSLICSKSGL